MFIIGKIISDGETNFTQHKYNKLQKISAKNKSISAKVQIWDHLRSSIKWCRHLYVKFKIDYINIVLYYIKRR